MLEDSYLDFCMAYGRSYLAVQGPTSRLEDQLTATGEKYDIHAEVYATPTGLFVSVAPLKKVKAGEIRTAVSRIKETNMNLNQLCWLEALLEDVHSKKISPSAAIKVLKTKRFKKPVYNDWQKLFAAFVMGVAISYPTFLHFAAALLCGLITMGTFYITGPALSRYIESAIFKDFVGCLFTLTAAAGIAQLIKAPIEALSIGGLILLVPGLALTSAISELADQNFISGTAKLMKAILTLVSIGIAYLLFNDFAPNIKLSEYVPQRSSTFALTAVFGIFFSVLGFAVIFQVPRKALPWAAMTGVISWAVLHQFESARYLVMASFLASATVGMISLALGMRFRVPSQTYSVPGILALLPGMLALSSFRSFAAGLGDSGIQTAFRVTLVASAIVFGLFFARIPFVISANILRFRRK